jgi:hypothetical protein
VTETVEVKQTERKQFPRSFRRIRLELPREKGNPSGNARDGYIVVAPLDAESKIDAELWRQHRDLCRFVRFRPDGEQNIGHLVHKPGGAGGVWAFHNDIRGLEEDDRGYRLAHDRFVIGEYVSIRENRLSTHYLFNSAFSLRRKFVSSM